MTIQNKVLSVSDSTGGGVPCPKCRFTFPPMPKTAPNFFELGSVICRHCQAHVDLWAAALDWMAVSGGSSLPLMSLGAEFTRFQFELRAGEYKELRLNEHGVPEDVLLLHVVFTPQGGDCIPNIVHGNVVPARPLSMNMIVFGKPLTPPLPPAPVSANVTWVRPSPDSVSWVYLAEAFDAFAAKTHWHMLVPAYVAYEIALTSLLREYLEKTVSKEKVKTFLVDAGSFHAFNVLLPLICSFVKTKPLPDVIRDALDDLRQARNRLMHKGLEKDTVSQERASRFLCAAVFGLEHLRYVRERLVEQPLQPRKATGPHFYRYQSCEHLEWLKPIILEHLLYVPLASQLNDPLDCKPKINPMSEEDMFLFLRNDYLRRHPTPALDLLQEHDATLRQRLQTLGLEWFLKQMADILYGQMDEFRVYSLSRRFDNFSLWAKYADGHKGYCLEFTNEGPLFGEHTLEVTYGDYPPFDMNDAKQRNAVHLTYKRRDWSNEEEVRLIRARGAGELVKIEPQWLTRMILGKDIREEHRKQILEWANQREPKLSVVQASFDALRHELRLTPLP